MAVEIGRIQAIYRYPVKSMAGESLEGLHMDWHGLDGDRRFAFRRTAEKGGFPWLSASKLPAMILYQPIREESAEDKNLPTHVITPDGNVLPIRSDELRDEIMRLSMRYGVLGEYTAFFAREGSRLDDWQALTAACQAELDGRAVATRSGLGAISQADNLSMQKLQSCANPRNWHYDAARNVVEVANVQQVCDRAFLRRGDTWIDGNSVVRQQLAPDRRVELGSAEFWQLARRLEREGRSGVLALRGQILLDVDGRNVLITTGGGSPMPLPDQLRNQTSNQTSNETSNQTPKETSR